MAGNGGGHELAAIQPADIVRMLLCPEDLRCLYAFTSPVLGLHHTGRSKPALASCPSWTFIFPSLDHTRAKDPLNLFG